MDQLQSQSSFKVMPMTYDDIPEVLAIDRRVCSHPWTEKIFSDCLRVGYNSWVCKKEGEITGFLIFSIAVQEMHILNISIHPDWQRRHLGSLFIQHAEKFAIKQDVIQSFLEVRSSNTAAKRLYQKHGYQIIGLRKGYYPADQGREDAMLMSKKLA